MESWLQYVILLLTGAVAGTLNVIAGGGSFLTLAVLIFLGLPATLANGTNRVGILVESAAAVHSFAGKGVLDWRSFRWAALPATGGALVGSLVAVRLEDEAFQKILAVLMVAVTLWALWDPFKLQDSARGVQRSTLFLSLGFFAVGIYGGFVQAGVGFFLLAATTWAGLDLVRGNAVKVLTVLVFTLMSLAVFAWQNKVVWVTGMVLAAGFAVGGRLGSPADSDSRTRLGAPSGDDDHRRFRHQAVAGVMNFKFLIRDRAGRSDWLPESPVPLAGLLLLSGEDRQSVSRRGGRASLSHREPKRPADH